MLREMRRQSKLGIEIVFRCLWKMNLRRWLRRDSKKGREVGAQGLQ